MTDPTSIQFYINATWYGDDTEYTENFMQVSGFTQSQFNSFTNLDEPSSFSSRMADQNLENALYFECTDKENCTSTELADM